MSDVFQRTGRGGAGNYYSQKDVEEAQKAQRANDLEAQKEDSSTAAEEAPLPPASAPASHAPQYVRVGRGGAGNYSEPATVAASQDVQDVVDQTTAAVRATGAGKPRTGLSGRGGAGNWTSDAERRDETDDKSEQERIADKIRHDIDASLPPPPKTYHQHDRDME
ncbi:hypothetical protein VM1G_00746 [Cytospora mali]|uniref:Uncharacterized protein n=1 Tax=Cytospora mali TaxID=578113 RepID=A0A194VN22_CYTMA|nr:hypothetical protein VM1G_00746 [Valsa mali]